MDIRKATVTILMTTGAVSSAFSTVVNGVVKQVCYRPTTSLQPSTKKLVSVCRDSSAELIIKFMAQAATTRYQPSLKNHSSTGAAVGSTLFQIKSMPLADQRIKVCTPAASSKNSVSAAVDIYY